MKDLKRFLKYPFLYWFLASFVSLFLFAKLSEEVILDQSANALDIQISNWVYTLRTPFLTNVMKLVTDSASTVSVIILISLLLLVLFLLKKKKYIIPILLSTSVGSALVLILKEVTKRARPLTQNALVAETSYSFPSGHAMFAVAVYGLVFYFLFKNTKNKWLKGLIAFVCLLVISLIGFSRIYLGAHWPTDVLASYLLGGSIVCFLIGILEVMDLVKKHKKMI